MRWEESLILNYVEIKRVKNKKRGKRICNSHNIGEYVTRSPHLFSVSRPNKMDLTKCKICDRVLTDPVRICGAGCDNMVHALCEAQRGCPCGHPPTKGQCPSCRRGLTGVVVKCPACQVAFHQGCHTCKCGRPMEVIIMELSRKFTCLRND